MFFIFFIKEYIVLEFSYGLTGQMYYPYAIVVTDMFFFYRDASRYVYSAIGLSAVICNAFFILHHGLAAWLFPAAIIQIIVLDVIYAFLRQKEKMNIYSYYLLVLLAVNLGCKLWYFPYDPLINFVGIAVGSLFAYGVIRWGMSVYNRYAVEIRRIQYASLHDRLTGLLNYRAFSDFIGKEEQVNGKIVGIIDIDHFKQINDTYGHLEGNRILKIFATTIRLKLKEAFGDQNAEIYRFGGEEFCFVLTDASLKHCAEAMDKIEDELQNMIFTTQDGRKVNVTFSCGIALQEDKAIHSVLRDADNELYRAKDQGRAQICYRRSSASAWNNKKFIVAFLYFVS